jgi:hypothetical protein
MFAADKAANHARTVLKFHNPKKYILTTKSALVNRVTFLTLIGV